MIMKDDKGDRLDNVSSMDEKKTSRKRQKKLLSDIQNQVEFYFSDPNLRKDRFLNQEIQKSSDGYIDIGIIASFNKILELTEDVDLVVKALKNSPELEVNKEGTHLKRRKPLVEPKYDPDLCTVYVECLPNTADITWIQKTFSYCGNVVYVSLPRYKSTGDIKGFAFIEYETPDEAQRACQILNNPLDDFGPPGMFPKTRKGKYINVNQSDVSQKESSENADGVPSEDRKKSTVTTKSSHDKKHDREEHKDATTSKKESADHSDRAKLKRRRGVEDKDKNRMKRDDSVQQIDECDEQRDRKAVKSVIVVVDSTTAGFESDRKGIGKSRKRKSREDEVDDGETNSKKKIPDSDSKENVEGRGPNKTKERKKNKVGEEAKSRKRKVEDVGSAKNQKRKKGDSVNDDDDDVQRDVHAALRKVRETTNTGPVAAEETEEARKGKKRLRQKKTKEEPQLFLRVISKAEWLQLKKEYLHLQRIGMREMKEAMRAQWRGTVSKTSNDMKTDQLNKESNTGPAAKDPKSSLFSYFFQSKPDTTSAVKEPKSEAPEFIEGVVVKIQSQEPIVSRKELRAQLDKVSSVAYVDLEDGDMEGFVRFKTAQGAEAVISNRKNINVDGISFTQVSGDPEKEYWEKLKADRERKLNSNTKRKRGRGKQRILQKAERDVRSTKSSHMRFDDN